MPITFRHLAGDAVEVTCIAFLDGDTFQTPATVPLERDLFLCSPPNNGVCKYVVLQRGINVSITFISSSAGANDYLMHISDQPGDDYVAMQGDSTQGPIWNGGSATAYQYGYPINPNSGSWGASWFILGDPEVDQVQLKASQDRLAFCKRQQNLRKSLRPRPQIKPLSIQHQDGVVDLKF